MGQEGTARRLQRIAKPLCVANGAKCYMFLTLWMNLDIFFDPALRFEGPPCQGQTREPPQKFRHHNIILCYVNDKN